MLTQMQTQRMSLRPFSVLMFTINTMLNFDGDANADVKREWVSNVNLKELTILLLMVYSH